MSKTKFQFEGVAQNISMLNDRLYFPSKFQISIHLYRKDIDIDYYNHALFKRRKKLPTTKYFRFGW